MIWTLFLMSLIAVSAQRGDGSVLPASGNMFTAEKVCLTGRVSDDNDPNHHAVTAQMFGATNFRLLCNTLSVCHSPKAFQRCQLYNQINDSELARRFIEDNFGSVKVVAIPSNATYPIAGATQHKSVPLMTVTGNIGHDMYNTLLDVYGFQQKNGGQGFYDALFLEAMWFKGKSSWDKAKLAPHTSWLWTVMKAIYNTSGAIPFYYASNPGMARGKGSFQSLGAKTVCIDKLHVKAEGIFAENIGWDALQYVPGIRKDVLGLLDKSKLGDKYHQQVEPGKKKITLYMRGDATRRKFLADNVKQAVARMGATHLIVKMPITDPVDQIMTFATSDVFVAPFGSNTANSIFMKPGSIFIEVSTLCSDMCLQKCHPYSKTGATGSDIMASNMFGIDKGAACSNLMADGPPLHRSTGVRYHIIGDCNKPIKCKNGKVFKGDQELTHKKAWKDGFNDNIALDPIIEQINKIMQGEESTVKKTKAAPFSIKCPLAPA